MRAIGSILILLACAGSAIGHASQDAPIAFGDAPGALHGQVQGLSGSFAVAERAVGEIPCAAGSPTVPLSQGGHVTVRENATHVAFLPSLANPAYFAVGVDREEAVRTLILMREYAMELYGVGALILGPSHAPPTTALMGVPHEIEGAPVVHEMDHVLEGRGIRISYEDPTEHVSFCGAGDGVGVVFERSAFEALSPGGIAHVIILVDEEIVQLLPRPIDGSTAIVEVGLYLSREEEDPAAVLRAVHDGPASLLLASSTAALMIACAVGGTRGRTGANAGTRERASASRRRR